MYRICLLYCVFLHGFILPAFPQQSEQGVWAGTAFYSGDLNTGSGLRFIGPAAGVLWRYNFNAYVVAKSHLAYGSVHAADNASKQVWEQQRNLSFSSPVFEFSQQVEINFFKYDKSKPAHAFTPYVFAGFGMFRYDPRAGYEGETYHLQSLGTEGQNTPIVGYPLKYSGFSATFPFGGGFKYSLNRYWSLNLEIGKRKTATDYLDDVSTAYVDPDLIMRYDPQSGTAAAALACAALPENPQVCIPGKQRGNSRNTDSYMFVGLIVTYTVWSEKCPTP